MKKFFFISFISLLPLSLLAQKCGGYYYLQNHAEIQMTSYGKDGTPGVVVTSHISGLSNIPGGIESNFTSTVKDKDGKVLDQGQGIMKCENGILSMDMKQSMPSGAMKQFQNMRVVAKESYMIYPSSMSVGQSLPGASFHMDIYKKESGNRFATIDYAISKRKVAGKEPVTTPAGTWDCFKITYDMVMKVKIGIGIPMHFKIVEWFAPGFGIVKTADFSKKGKEVGYTELTMLKK